jgi:hypothetical protein
MESPVSCCDEVNELGELVNVLCFAPRREHVVSQLANVITASIVGVKVRPQVIPLALDDVLMGVGLDVFEAGAVVNAEMRVTLRSVSPVRSPAISDDRSAGFDPCIYYGYQCFRGSILNGNEKPSTGFAFNTAEDPLPLNGVPPMIFSLTKFALIDPNGLLNTTDFLRAPFQVYEHCFSTEPAQVRDRSSTEAMLFLDPADRYTAHYIIGEEHSFLESKVTMLKP